MVKKVTLNVNSLKRLGTNAYCDFFKMFFNDVYFEFICFNCLCTSNVILKGVDIMSAAKKLYSFYSNS